MTRTLTAGMQTEVAAQRGTIVYLIQLESSGGTIRLTTAPLDISWDTQTWEGVGGLLEFSGVEETSDVSNQSLELGLSGVDQTILSVLLNNDFRNRDVRVWLAHLLDAGTIVADPLEIFRGFQNGDYTISETRDPDMAGTVVIRTRVGSSVALLRRATAIRNNEVSHNDMLKRAGLTTGDTFFQNVGSIAGKIASWAGEPPPHHPGEDGRF